MFVMNEKENYEIIDNNIDKCKTTYKRENLMNIKENDQVTKFRDFFYGEWRSYKKKYSRIFKNKKVVIFGLPGAYTSVCSAKHLPGYVEDVWAI